MRPWLLAVLLAARPAGAAYESAPVPESPPVSAPLILDPGHGGDDLGAVAGKKREKDIALAIARKVKQKLEALGTPIRLTRDSDVFVPLDGRVDQTLQEGLAFVSLHVNLVKSKKASGIRVYAFGKEDYHTKVPFRKKPLEPLPTPSRAEAKASGDLAAAIVHSLRVQGYRVDPPAKAGYYVLKHPNLPSVLIELGYLSNPKEAAMLGDAAYQERLADAVAASLGSYLLASR